MKKPHKSLSRRRNKYQSKVGLPPGSIVHVGDVRADDATIEVIDYNAERVNSANIDDVETLYSYLDSFETNTWVRFSGLHETGQISEIGSKLEIHPLVMEDIVNTSQRPKVEAYDDYLYIVIKHLKRSDEDGGIVSNQISLILSKACVLSFHEEKEPVFDSIKPRIDVPNGRFRKYGSDYLCYALIDLVVDNYFSILEDFNDEVIQIEDSLMANTETTNYDNLHQLRRKLILMRRHMNPMREVVQGLIREDNELISDGIKLYMRDVNDHLMRVIESLEHTLDISASLMETHMTQINIRSGEVMKVLTIIATIFIPLTFVAGIYGMNFNPEGSPYNMPELDWYYGYPISLGFMFVLTLGMLFYFRRKKWI